jgi:hypothetical protein
MAVAWVGINLRSHLAMKLDWMVLLLRRRQSRAKVSQGPPIVMDAQLFRQINLKPPQNDF